MIAQTSISKLTNRVRTGIGSFLGLTAPPEKRILDREYLALAEKFQKVTSGRAAMRKNQSIWNRTKPLAGNDESYAEMLVTHPLVYTMASTRARMSQARRWGIVGGSDSDREYIKGLFEKIGWSSKAFDLLRESMCFGKSVLEIVKTEVEVYTSGPNKGRPIVRDGEIVFTPIKNKQRYDLHVISPQVIKEIRHDLGYIQYHIYVTSKGELQKQDQIPDLFDEDELAIFYTDRLAGREFATSMASLLEYHVDQYNQTDSNMSILSDKYTLGFWVFIADPAWLNNPSAGAQEMEDARNKWNTYTVGSDVFIPAGFDVQSRTMDIRGLDAIIQQKKIIFEESANIFGLSPATFAGKRDTRTPFELDTVESDLRSLEDFINSDVIPKILGKRDGWGLPRLRYFDDPDVNLKLMKSLLMATAQVPNVANVTAEMFGEEYDPSDEGLVNQADTTPGNQVDSKPPKQSNSFGRTNSKAINYTGSKIPAMAR